MVRKWLTLVHPRAKKRVARRTPLSTDTLSECHAVCPFLRKMHMRRGLCLVGRVIGRKIVHVLRIFVGAELGSPEDRVTMTDRVP